MEEPCKNCGFDVYELIDGHYYCLECHEELEDLVDKEIDNFENENIIFDFRGGIKQKDVKKEAEKQKAVLEAKCTSFEEYNFILRGLVDEILNIEYIPNFKKTVLQLWIHFLKTTEVAFFDKEEPNHLPRLHAFYRQQDAQILYNKKPIKRKIIRKKKPKVEIKIEDDSKEAKKLKRRSARKSLKKIQKMNDDSESFVSSNTSTLSNMTIEDIEATMLGQELKIEFSNAAKVAKQRYEKHKKARKIDVKYNEDGDIEPKLHRYHCFSDIVLILTGKTLLFIIYCALNICGSTIQFSDLLRFARDGHISYWNFKKHLPEKLENTKLSLTQFHTLKNAGYYTMHFYLRKFFVNFPEIKDSLRTPNLIILIRRYIDDLNLPTCLSNYAEKLIELLPSKLQYKHDFVPNFEARAMAYLIFIIKLVFGIDGYREKEISGSVTKINSELNKLSFPHKLFNYEAWREYIEYRDVLLNKYYFPSIHNDDFNHDRPYEHFVSSVNAVQHETFHVYTTDDKMNRHQRKNIHKKAVTKELVQKLLNLHIEDPAKDLKFECSLTPLKDALRVILESPLESTINKKNLVDFSEHSLEFFFEPEKLEQIFEDHEVELYIKNATFPKNFSFQKCEHFFEYNFSSAKNEIVISHDTINEHIWLKNMKKEEKNRIKKELDVKVEYHHKKMTKMIKKRYELRKSVMLNNNEDLDYIGFDEVVAIGEDENMYDDSLIFVCPDFNLWHRLIPMKIENLRSFKSDIRKLPKSFLWLLNTASKVIQQPIDLIYFQLMLLENEFIKVYHPLELTDNKLEVKKKEVKYETIHQYW